MEIQGFCLHLCSADGGVLPSIMHDGRCYVVAQPGASFCARLLIKNGKKWTQNQLFKAKTRVDGRNVGFNKILKPNTLKFVRGFEATKRSTEKIQYRFHFSDANPRKILVSDSKEDVCLVDHEIGSVCVDFYLAAQPEKSTCRICDPRLRKQGVVSSREVIDEKKWKISSEAKFWKSASLATKAGNAITRPRGGCKHTRIRRKSQNPIASLKLFYETAETLKLRGIISPEMEEFKSHFQTSSHLKDEFLDFQSSLKDSNFIRRQKRKRQSSNSSSPQSTRREVTTLCDLTIDDDVEHWIVKKQRRTAIVGQPDTTESLSQGPPSPSPPSPSSPSPSPPSSGPPSPSPSLSGPPSPTTSPSPLRHTSSTTSAISPCSWSGDDIFVVDLIKDEE